MDYGTASGPGKPIPPRSKDAVTVLYPHSADIMDKFKAVTGEALPDYAAKIPTLVLNGLVNYLYYGSKPGHFLCAVLTNNLFEAVARSDNDSLAALREIIWLVYNRTPSPSWGDKAKIEAWGEQRKVALREVKDLEAAVGPPVL